MAEEKKIVSAVEKNEKKLLAFIRGRVNNKEDSEDILQEVWYQLSRIINIDEIENISAWLYRVARNKITDLYRRPKVIQNTDLELFEGDDGTFLKKIFFTNPETPEDSMVKEIFWEELMNGLDELPENQRDVFIQNELEGIKLREIAEQSNVNLKTVLSRKQYAVKFLRTRLKNLYDDLVN